MWTRFWNWLGGRAGNGTKSPSDTPPQPPGLNPPTFPFSYDSSGTPTANATLDVLGPNGAWTSFQFELDSGAYITTLPQSAANALGLIVEQGTPLSLIGVSGEPIPFYVHTLTVRFHGYTQTFQLPIAFANAEIAILLGRYAFWNQLGGINLAVALRETVFS